MELYLKYRPKKFKDLIGKTSAIKSLIKMTNNGETPHAIMLSGPSGCGKTTVARILAKRLGATDTDITEIDSAHFRGIDTIREIRTHMGRSPYGECRAWIIDECHNWRRDVQDSALKMLEDTPSHVFFMLATTDPQKLNAAVRNRCTHIKVRALTSSEMEKLIKKILKLEKKKISGDVVDKIVEVASGSPRKALVLLNQIIPLKGESQQLDAIQNTDCEQQSIELARKLMNPWCKFPDLLKVLRKIDEEPESIRRMILGYATKVALGGGNSTSRAITVIGQFSGAYYDTGMAGLVYDCFAMCVNGKKR